jgi:hypothetical protein
MVHHNKEEIGQMNVPRAQGREATSKAERFRRFNA